jgi:uncharacterized hydrophobic protein (TIGR00341 family)
MALRVLQVTVPEPLADTVGEIVEGLHDPEPVDTSVWRGEGCRRFDLILEARDTEHVLDLLSDRFGESEGFRVVVLPVEATLPRPPVTTSPESTGDPQPHSRPDRVSRDELYADLTPATHASRMFFVQVMLATVVAAVGLVTDSTAVTIGAMVLAPLLGPNVALAFGATLGDLDFVRAALRTNVAGLALALALSAGVGVAMTVDTTLPSIFGRTSVHLSDVALALAAGAAGTLATLSSVSTALVGVMVAVALMPPLVVAGLLAGSGQWDAAAGAAMLVAVNVICVNLAGVATFVVMGVRPQAWWERADARRSSRIAMLVWAVLLTVLLVVLLISEVG